MSQQDTPPAVQALIDKQAINELLVRHSHGLDRCDRDTLANAYWPDATVDYGVFNGPASGFVDVVMSGLAAMQATMHRVANVLIHLDGDKAKAQSYAIVFHHFQGESGMEEMITGGRYLDRLEKRNGEWRLSHRLFVLDWNQNGPSSAEWEKGIYATLKVRGGRHPDDPYNAFMAD